jgi:hypothetical protein
MVDTAAAQFDEAPECRIGHGHNSTPPVFVAQFTAQIGGCGR